MKKYRSPNYRLAYPAGYPHQRGALLPRALLTTVLIVAYSSVAAEPYLTRNYRAHLDQQPAGNVTQQWTQQADMQTLREYVQLQSPDNPDDWQYRSDMQLVRDAGGLLRYELAFQFNNDRVLHTCVRQETALWCSANTVLSTAEQVDNAESATVEQLASGVLFNAVPYASEAAAVLSLFSDDAPQNTSLRLPLSDIDTTVAGLPDYLWQHVTTLGEAAGVSFRLLTIEDLQLIDTRAIRQADVSCRTPDGTTICRVFSVTNHASSSRWLLYRSQGSTPTVTPLHINYKDSNSQFTLQLDD